MLIDSHCHLQHCFTGENVLEQEILKISSQLRYFVDVSTNEQEFLNMRDRPLPVNLLLSYGLYPEESAHYTREKGEIFKGLTGSGLVKAIGESGMDYHRNYGTHESQEALFRDQIETSIEHNLPLIVHSRDAFEDTYRVLSSYEFNRAVIIHCFGYAAREAEEFLALGFFLSFAGNVTYPGASGIREGAVTAPVDRLLLETDSPYLAPVPLRGTRNNPLNVKHTYKFISGLKNIAPEELETSIERNFRLIFGLK
jgi:TatD DNase family protein